jgi:class 3 adenylate cyclase
MPLFIDIHEIPGITSEVAAAGHIKDLDAQGPFGVDYSKYWFNQASGKIFCFCEAPSAQAAIAVHQQAHGVGAERIIEVTPELCELFMGPSVIDSGGAVMLPADLGSAHDPGTRTVLFTDIVDSTGMTQRLGDEAAMDVLAVHDTIVRDALAATNGREVKHTGDGIMAAFASAASAIRCAAGVQSDIAQRNVAHPDQLFQVRIGVAAGEPVGRENDLFGATVQLAARLCAHAQPAQILVSSVVADLCIGKSIRFREIGDVALKGFDGPVSVREVDYTVPV